MSKPDLVLVHGWGLNKAVWANIITPLAAQFEVHCISLPGYGDMRDLPCPETLDGIASCLLEQAPKSAHWCGWSLGGMAAIRAALESPERIISLSLLCTTPKFVSDKDWTDGTDIAIFEKFSAELAADYKRSIRRFLLLQAGTIGDAKNLAKQALLAMEAYPAPSESTLEIGLDILKNTDLRNELKRLSMPCISIAASRDRIVPPAASEYLAGHIPDANYLELNSGHAPHLSDPETLVELLARHHLASEKQTKGEVF